jgi:predicted GNAT family acetyltransferase
MTMPSVQSESVSTGSNTVHPLDNVVWTALTTRQAALAESYDQACRFLPDVSTIAAFLEPSDRGWDSLAHLVHEGLTVNLALREPYQPRPGWKQVLVTPMPQMVFQGNIPQLLQSSNPEVSIIELGSSDVPEMLELTALTKPGPFSKRTPELGRYIGIRQDGRLIAMAGERLKVSGYTEVSAVCTHPEHAGRGYARLLMTEIMRQIFDRGEIPFLHVRGGNAHAIGLYERMGFVQRVVKHLAVLKRESKGL